MDDRTARVNMSFESHTAGDVVVAPEELLAPYVNGGYMTWIDEEADNGVEATPFEPAEIAVEATEPKKATRGKAGA